MSETDPYNWLNEPIYAPNNQDDEIVEKIADTAEPEFGKLWMGCYWKYCDSIIQLSDPQAQYWFVQPNYHKEGTSLMFCCGPCLRSWTNQASEFEKTGMVKVDNLNSYANSSSPDVVFRTPDTNALKTMPVFNNEQQYLRGLTS